MAGLVLLALVAEGHPAEEAESRADPGARYLSVDATTLQWREVPVPRGAMQARYHALRLALVRWPPTAGIPMHVRTPGWHGITLSGVLVLRAKGHSEHRLRPFTHFYVKNRTPFSARCAGPEPCSYLAFDEIEEISAQRELALLPLDRGTANETVGTATGLPDHEDLRLRLVDVAADEWRRLEGAAGVWWPRGDPSPLRGYVLSYYAYKLAQGASLPRASGISDVAVYVLSGVVQLQVDNQPGERLGTDSFYVVLRGAPYSDRCAEGPCFVLTTEPPPGWPRSRIFP